MAEQSTLQNTPEQPTAIGDVPIPAVKITSLYPNERDQRDRENYEGNFSVYTALDQAGMQLRSIQDYTRRIALLQIQTEVTTDPTKLESLVVEQATLITDRHHAGLYLHKLITGVQAYLSDPDTPESELPADFPQELLLVRKNIMIQAPDLDTRIQQQVADFKTAVQRLIQAKSTTTQQESDTITSLSGWVEGFAQYRNSLPADSQLQPVLDEVERSMTIISDQLANPETADQWKQNATDAIAQINTTQPPVEASFAPMVLCALLYAHRADENPASPLTMQILQLIVPPTGPNADQPGSIAIRSFTELAAVVNQQSNQSPNESAPDMEQLLQELEQVSIYTERQLAGGLANAVSKIKKTNKTLYQNLQDAGMIKVPGRFERFVVAEQIKPEFLSRLFVHAFRERIRNGKGTILLDKEVGENLQDQQMVTRRTVGNKQWMKLTKHGRNKLFNQPDDSDVQRIKAALTDGQVSMNYRIGDDLLRSKTKQLGITVDAKGFDYMQQQFTTEYLGEILFGDKSPGMVQADEVVAEPSQQDNAQPSRTIEKAKRPKWKALTMAALMTISAAVLLTKNYTGKQPTGLWQIEATKTNNPNYLKTDFAKLTADKVWQKGPVDATTALVDQWLPEHAEVRRGVEVGVKKYLRDRGWLNFRNDKEQRESIINKAIAHFQNEQQLLVPYLQQLYPQTYSTLTADERKNLLMFLVFKYGKIQSITEAGASESFVQKRIVETINNGMGLQVISSIVAKLDPKPGIPKIESAETKRDLSTPEKAVAYYVQTNLDGAPNYLKDFVGGYFRNQIQKAWTDERLLRQGRLLNIASDFELQHNNSKNQLARLYPQTINTISYQQRNWLAAYLTVRYPDMPKSLNDNQVRLVKSLVSQYDRDFKTTLASKLRQ